MTMLESFRHHIRDCLEMWALGGHLKELSARSQVEGLRSQKPAHLWSLIKEQPERSHLKISGL